MASGDTVTPPSNIQEIQDDVLKLWNVVELRPEISYEQKNKIKDLHDSVVRSLKNEPAESHPPTVQPRARRASSQFLRPQASNVQPVHADKVPLLHIKHKVGTNWE